MTESQKEKFWIIGLWMLLGIIMISLFYYSYYRVFDYDEIEHIHTSWKMLQGQEIYVDFLQHHHPFFNYLLVPVIGAVGSNVDSMFAARYIMLFLTLCILAMTYLLSIRIFESTEIGIISVIFTSTVVSFYMKSIEIRPDVLQALAGLISIYFLFSYYRGKSLGSLILSSVFLAVSFLFLQKSILLMLAIGILLLYDLYKKNISLKYILYYGVAFLVCISPYYIYITINGTLEQYFILNWLVNLELEGIIPKTQYIHLTFMENIITIVLYLIGVVTLLKSGVERRFAVLSLLLLILTVVMFSNLWRQYYMPAIPLVGIVAAYSLYTLFSIRWIRIVVLLGAIYFPMSIMHNHEFFKMDREGQARQLEKINYVLSETNENDKVHDGHVTFNVFRDDISYFWFCPQCYTAYNKIQGYQYNLLDSIAVQKPKFISRYSVNTNDRRIKNHYKISKYPDLLIRKD